ncbi:MAG: hypothetical protein QM704_18685 [Anaeromyxobacteraceae bacterium]
MNPATGAAIPRSRFVVVGHDRLRFVDAPLSALGPVNFYDHERAVALEAWVVAALGARAATLQDLAARVRAMRIEASVDPDRLVVRSVVKTPTHAFEVLATPEGVRVSRVAPVGGAPFEVAPGFPALDLAQFRAPGDLELFLSGSVREMEAARPERAPAPAAAPPAGSGALEATPAPRNALTLRALADVFGEDAMLAPNAMVELLQEFRHGGTRYRFVASREVGSHFRGRLIGPNGDVWSDRFELDSFPGTEKVVALALGIAQPSAGGEPVDLGGGEGMGDVPSHLLPHPGEVWVMSVVVEETHGDEVRYVGTDIDGRPYGAARVLKRSDFEAVFSQERGGWRLLVVIDQVNDGAVIYRQLDRQRQPIGAPRRMAAAILVANFVPEAAAY